MLPACCKRNGKAGLPDAARTLPDSSPRREQVQLIDADRLSGREYLGEAEQRLRDERRLLTAMPQ
jgi:hypothetical protein